ncbi:MAG TPA: hypothetical protein VD790_04035 [Thermoleophilaceae bacterium]|nr:hypothetical protein [Thermoleophilaceae bacterium]
MKRRYGLAAIACLAVGYATVIHSLGWAETSNFALVRALADGRAEIDQWHWETKDKAWHDGHFYSVKAPGLALLATPAYKALTAVGGTEASADLARTAREGGASRWARQGTSKGLYSDDPNRAETVRARIEDETPMVWALGLVGAVIPALVLLLLVRHVVERIEPGYGAATAVALGAGTLILPFATLFFSHVLSAMLAFAAFAVLWRERASNGDGPRSLRPLVAAGSLAGLAIVTEYPLGLAAVVLGVYAIGGFTRGPGPVVNRGLAYAGGVAAGIAPLVAYNVWAFGSLTHSSYKGAVAIQGDTGHDVVGLNEGGFFGIEWPDFQIGLDLLFANKGLVTLTPILGLALVGLVLLHRRGLRAEAYVICGLLVAYLTYNSGYWLPFGGGSPGPRFLVPVLPFLALPLAVAWRRWPATALALTVASVVLMATATATIPLIGNDDIGYWAHIVGLENFEHTVLSLAGLDNGWPALTPFVLALLLAAVLAARATGPVEWRARERLVAAGIILAWALLAVLLPEYRGRDLGPDSHTVVPLVAAAAAAGLLALAMTTPLSRLGRASRGRSLRSTRTQPVPSSGRSRP